MSDIIHRGNRSYVVLSEDDPEFVMADNRHRLALAVAAKELKAALEKHGR